LPLNPEPQAPNQLDTLFEGSSLTAGDALIRKNVTFVKLAEAAATVETPNPQKNEIRENGTRNPGKRDPKPET
jgi:hypothetical protein